MKKIKYLAAILLLAVTLNAGFIIFNFNKNEAKAYCLLNFDLVDSGKHLDWDGNTAYMTAWLNGIKVWNSVNNIIRPDSWKWVEDVTVLDYFDDDTNALALTFPEGQIRFNTYYMDNMTEEQRQKTAMHEIGHALGIDHNNIAGSIMLQGIISQTTLHQDDKDAFNWLYAHRY